MRAKLHPTPVLWQNLDDCVVAIESALYAAIAARRQGNRNKHRALLYCAAKHTRTAKQLIAILERLEANAEVRHERDR